MNYKILAFSLSACLILRHEISWAELRTLQEKNAKGLVIQERSYEDSRLVEEKLYNHASGELGTWIQYQYLSPDRVIKTNLSVNKEEKGRILSKEEWSGLDIKNEKTASAVRWRAWSYSSSKPYNLEFIATYGKENPERILAKQYLNEKNELKSTITFTYQPGKEKPVAFVETSPQGKILSKYSLYEKYDLAARLRELGKSTAEINALVSQRENPDKFLVAVIDTGFDYNHADLVTKWWNNPLDPIDGIDNDDNGWVDDNFGWDQVANQHLPSEAIISFSKDERPLSHGTHVAAIASHGLDNIGLIGFGGEYTDVNYINKMSAFIKKHQVKVVNMSLAIPLDHKDQLGLKASVTAYRNMIEANPNTLFVVAVGNEMMNLDVPANRQYPASFTQPNVLKVGALDVGHLDAITSKTAMAYFSNWGKKTVDILAPGWEVWAAGLGGGLIAHSGTSMATPYMVHEVVQLWSSLPHLSASEVREIFITTAHKLSPPPDIKSGGYVDLKSALRRGRIRFLEGRKTLKNGPNCWNASTHLANVSQGIHYTTEAEFRFLLDSPLCKQIAPAETQPGDILALRRYDRMGKLLPAPYMSEVHGYTELGDGMGLSKNGQDARVGYEKQKKTDIFAFYKSKEFKNCKMIGMDRQDCILKETAHRCQGLADYFAGKLSVVESDLLSKVQTLEKELSQYFIDGLEVKNKTERILDLQNQMERLQAQGSDSLFIDAVAFRLSSMSSQF